MSSRIVVFPVVGRRWAFTAVPSTGNGPVNIPTPVMSLRELFRTIQTLPLAGDKVEALTSYGSDKMHQRWVALGTAPEGSIRRRVHIIGERTLSRLGPSESFLKAIPKDAGLVEIVYPKCVNPRLVRRRVRHLASSGEVVHRNYMYGSVALLPFSMLFGILPLPNVVLAWNLFRAYSHWRAVQGSRRLHYLVTDSPTEVSSSSRRGVEASAETDGSTNTDTTIRVGRGDDATWVSNVSSHDPFHLHRKVQGMVLVPSEVLNTLLAPTNVSREPISDIAVSKICMEYSVDPNEILKWRDHKLPIKSFG